jgi:hypothetical protein
MECGTPYEDPQGTGVVRGDLQMICEPFQNGFIRVHLLFSGAVSVLKMTQGGK